MATSHAIIALPDGAFPIFSKAPFGYWKVL